MLLYEAGTRLTVYSKTRVAVPSPSPLNIASLSLVQSRVSTGGELSPTVRTETLLSNVTAISTTSPRP